MVDNVKQIQVQRKKVNSNKWESIKTYEWPEHKDALDHYKQRAEGYARAEEEHNPAYVCRVVTIEEHYRGMDNEG